jgi:hypothetical protein
VGERNGIELVSKEEGEYNWKRNCMFKLGKAEV